MTTSQTHPTPAKDVTVGDTIDFEFEELYVGAIENGPVDGMIGLIWHDGEGNETGCALYEPDELLNVVI
jgi:hypothetical protein